MPGISTADRDGIDLDEISVVQLWDRHDCSCGTRAAHSLCIERVEAGPALDVDDVRSDFQHIGGCGACRAQCREHVLERLVHLVLEWKMRGVRAVGSDAELARHEHEVTAADRMAVVAARRSQLVARDDGNVTVHVDHQPRIRGQFATISPPPRTT